MTNLRIELVPATITEYGCVRCQCYHVKGTDPLYDDHLPWQSKHGIRQRQDRDNFVPKGSPEAWVPRFA